MLGRLTVVSTVDDFDPSFAHSITDTALLNTTRHFPDVHVSVKHVVCVDGGHVFPSLMMTCDGCDEDSANIIASFFNEEVMLAYFDGGPIDDDDELHTALTVTCRIPDDDDAIMLCIGNVIECIRATLTNRRFSGVIVTGYADASVNDMVLYRFTATNTLGSGNRTKLRSIGRKIVEAVKCNYGQDTIVYVNRRVITEVEY